MADGIAVFSVFFVAYKLEFITLIYYIFRGIFSHRFFLGFLYVGKPQGPAAKLSKGMGLNREHGLQIDYYGFRFYSPGQGRFLNRDPINEPGSQLVRDVMKAGDLGEELNLYAFVGNDPINGFDLYGFGVQGEDKKKVIVRLVNALNRILQGAAQKMSDQCCRLRKTPCELCCGLTGTAAGLSLVGAFAANKVGCGLNPACHVQAYQELIRATESLGEMVDGCMESCGTCCRTPKADREPLELFPPFPGLH